MLIRRFRICPLNLLFGALVLLLGSFRVIAIPFVLLNVVRSTEARSRYNRAVQTGLLLTLLSPIDIGLPVLATVMGNSGSGVRVRHTDVGMSAVTELQAKYGEFVSLRCSGLPGVYQPTWWIVWWKHNAVPVSTGSDSSGAGGRVK